MHTRQIAARLHVSERTVVSHFTQVFLKLEAHTRAAAVRVALENGLLPAPTAGMPVNKRGAGLQA